jgi:hypothetical protein
MARNLNYLDLKGVKTFLKLADNVLNSRTVLLNLPFVASAFSVADWKTKLSGYLHTTLFYEDVLQAQIYTGWRNLEYDKERGKNNFRPKNKPRFKFYPKAKPYFVAMLTDKRDMPTAFDGMYFYSPYLKGIPEDEAEKVVDALFKDLFGASEFDFWAISPDFIATKSDGYAAGIEGKENFSTYFDGDAGLPTDTASLLISKDNAFLLLTNGND